MYKIIRTLAFSALFLTFLSPTTYAQDPDVATDALYVDQDAPNASDTNDGRYAIDGGTGPFKTIQAMVDALKPGMTGYVRQSSTPYYQNYRTSGADIGGISITQGGTENAPITISGYPGERPVINQRLSRSTDQNKPMSGFYVHQGNNIILRNFEITQANSSGIYTNPGSAEGLHVQNLIIEDMHIHHLYGGDNVGGVRLDNCERCVVRNSVIHDIYDTRTSSNPLTAEPYGLHAGIHGYGPRNTVIEKNTFYNLKRAVYQKHPNSYGDPSNIVRQNIFKDTDTAYAIEVAGYKAPPVYNAAFYGNLVLNTGTAVRAILNETATQSRGLKIYNNTLFKTRTLSYIRGIIDTQVFNNIIVDSDDYPIYSENTGTEELGNDTQYSYIDNNMYYNNSNIAMIDRSGDYYYFKDLSSWQAAISQYAAEHLAQDPGQSSVTEDPQFVDIASENFDTLNPTVEQIGRGGVYSTKIGLFGIFNDVGADAVDVGASIESAAPNPPMLEIK